MPKTNSSNNNQVDSQLVKHIAQLAKMSVSQSEAQKLASAFNETLAAVNQLQEIDTSKVEPTHQVTGLENCWREDVVNSDLSFTQKEALANAKQTYQGYFVVPRIINKDE